MPWNPPLTKLQRVCLAPVRAEGLPLSDRNQDIVGRGRYTRQGKTDDLKSIDARTPPDPAKFPHDLWLVRIAIWFWLGGISVAFSDPRRFIYTIQREKKWRHWNSPSKCFDEFRVSTSRCLVFG
jgi:hypothetical protein